MKFKHLSLKVNKCGHVEFSAPNSKLAPLSPSGSYISLSPHKIIKAYFLQLNPMHATNPTSPRKPSSLSLVWIYFANICWKPVIVPVLHTGKDIDDNQEIIARSLPYSLYLVMKVSPVPVTNVKQSNRVIHLTEKGLAVRVVTNSGIRLRCFQ